MADTNTPHPSRYERLGPSGVARCTSCGWTDWVSNLAHQGCFNPKCTNYNQEEQPS